MQTQLLSIFQDTLVSNLTSKGASTADLDLALLFLGNRDEGDSGGLGVRHDRGRVEGKRTINGARADSLNSLNIEPLKREDRG